MNQDFDLLDFLGELDYRQEIHARPRIVRPRSNWFADYDDLDFFTRYRMTKSTALYVLNLIDEELEFPTDKNCSVSPMNQFLIALRFFATGNHQIAVGDTHGVQTSTVSRIIKRVSSAVAGLRSRFVKMPSTNRAIEENQREFYNIAHFPYVIGTVDCTHVKIQSPGGEDAELFRNRKSYFSINVQTISDSRLKVQNIVARWPGSTHDSAIFINSRVNQEFEAGRYGNAVLLGDSGYPLKNYLLTPFLNPRTQAEEGFNASHIRTRNTVERQYGVVKRRFPALAIGLRIKLETAVNVTIACFVLHNICVEKNEAMPPPEFDEQYLNRLIEEGQIRNSSRAQNPQNIDRRTLILQNFFL